MAGDASVSNRRSILGHVVVAARNRQIEGKVAKALFEIVFDRSNRILGNERRVWAQLYDYVCGFRGIIT